MYWLSADNDFTELDKLPQTKLTASLVRNKNKDHETEWTINIKNNSPRIAFFIRPRLMSENEEVLPSFWSNSYFSLAPGEEITLTAGAPDDAIRDADPQISVEGWNIEKIQLQTSK